MSDKIRSYQLELLNDGLMPLGIHKGLPFAEVPVSYLRWYVSPTPNFDKELIEPVIKWAAEAEVDLSEPKLPDGDLSQHIGKVKDRIKVFLKVISIGPWNQGNYGPWRIIKLLDRSGNRFACISGDDAWKENHFYQMNVTIKDHTYWQGVKETKFNRPHYIKVLDENGKEIASNVDE